MNGYLVELPIVDASESPRRVFERMQESRRSGVVYFDKGMPFVVHAKDVLRGIAGGKETIAGITHVQIGMRGMAVRKLDAQVLPRPKASVVGITGTSAKVVFQSASKWRGVIEPPLMCRCRGRHKHPMPHGEHGETCRRDDQPFDCAR